ncbi:peptidylprolyl isomerase [Granulicella sp. L46]|uniref:peptidylprolyl isomerase n=1 Tax=Granulicella sp. L46 TaxID=1641865 RepID=UPI00131C6264|nr:peptidylprolyl isomerase [Granulicella sp. L46]
MMRRAAQLESRQWGGGTLLLLCALLMWVPRCIAQNAPVVPVVPTGTTAAPAVPALPAGSVPSVAQSQAGPTKIVEPTLPGMPPAQGEEVDRVVAIVNSQLILDSDVDRERRFAALLPYREASGPYNRDEAIERLINRDLILQQVQLQPAGEVTEQAAAKDLDALRKSIPACAEYHCETEEGWDKFLASEGFTEESLTTLWRQRMEVLAFIEQRFRMGIRILPAEIQEYYTKTMLPEYAAQHVTPPPMRTISRRIQEVLLQQRVSKLLDDWLASLRAQGNVVVLHPGEEAR